MSVPSPGRRELLSLPVGLFSCGETLGSSARGCPQPSCPGRSAARLPEEALRPGARGRSQGRRRESRSRVLCGLETRQRGLRRGPSGGGRARTASRCPGTPPSGRGVRGFVTDSHRASCLFGYASVVTVVVSPGLRTVWPDGTRARAVSLTIGAGLLTMPLPGPSLLLQDDSAAGLARTLGVQSKDARSRWTESGVARKRV